MKVESSEYPPHVEVIGSKKLVNFNIEELTRDDDGVVSIYYRYSQLKMHTADSDEAIAEAETKAKYADWKASRTEAVANIKVIVDGMEFDGDETSQTRMARAISVMDDAGTKLWVLANDEPAMVTKAQFVQALRLAGEAQTSLWVYA